MAFDKIQYRNFGPYSDLRFLLNGEEVAVLRCLGDIPGAPTMTDRLWKIFDCPNVEVCYGHETEWKSYNFNPLDAGDDPFGPEPKRPRFMPPDNDIDDARAEDDAARLRDVRATAEQLKG